MKSNNSIVITIVLSIVGVIFLSIYKKNCDLSLTESFMDNSKISKFQKIFFCCYFYMRKLFSYRKLFSTNSYKNLKNIEGQLQTKVLKTYRTRRYGSWDISFVPGIRIIFNKSCLDILLFIWNIFFYYKSIETTILWPLTCNNTYSHFVRWTRRQFSVPRSL